MKSAAVIFAICLCVVILSCASMFYYIRNSSPSPSTGSKPPMYTDDITLKLDSYLKYIKWYLGTLQT